MEPDFFIVNVASGQPAHQRFNTLTQYDFPVLNRGPRITKKMALDYLRKKANLPAQKKFANFNFLVYLADLIDVDVILF